MGGIRHLFEGSNSIEPKYFRFINDAVPASNDNVHFQGRISKPLGDYGPAPICYFRCRVGSTIKIHLMISIHRVQLVIYFLAVNMIAMEANQGVRTYDKIDYRSE